MRMRSSQILHREGLWHGCRVNLDHGPLYNYYLDRIMEVMQNAVRHYPRTLAIRCDLRFPSNRIALDNDAISSFTASLNAQVAAHESRKDKLDIRTHENRLRFVWVKEQKTANNWHYHVVLFFNRNAFGSLGSFPSKTFTMDDIDVPCAPAPLPAERNLASRIVNAWASALRKEFEDCIGLVHFPENPECHLIASDEDYPKRFADFFYRLSYFAKEDTKHFGNGSRSLGRSSG